LATSLAGVASELAAVPVRSPDRARIATVRITQGEAGATVSVSELDAKTGAPILSGSLQLPDVSGESSLLVTPIFAADSTTLCMVLALTSPSPTLPLKKLDPSTGQELELFGATWMSHHELAFFDGKAGTFIGPFDLGDEPSLALCNVGANDDSLFLWTIDEPARVVTEKGTGLEPETSVSVFPIGQGKSTARWAAPGPWPVNGESVIAVAGGDIVRLILGTTLQVYSAEQGLIHEMEIPLLANVRAKPSAARMDLLGDGTLLLSAPAVGAAIIVDPASGFDTVATLSYPVPRYAGGAPERKCALSLDRRTIYVLGDANEGGLRAYDAKSGSTWRTYASGQHFSGLQVLSDGTLLAVSPESPRLAAFNEGLEPVANGDVDLDVLAIV
jgi:hypothetical protein